jgi:hypothetical protein
MHFRRWLVLLLVAGSTGIAHAACEAWCTAPCSELNGDVRRECDTCIEARFTCRPGLPGYPATSAEPLQSTPKYATTVNAASGFVAPAEAAPPTTEASLDDVAGFEGSGDDDLSCFPYMRTISDGVQSMRICPVLNGIWTSFLDGSKWGSYGQPLSNSTAQSIAREMLLYDAVGLGTWIGEDFDARVLSALKAHSAESRGGAADEFDDLHTAAGTPGPMVPYSIIVENGHEVVRNLEMLKSILGPSALRWVQLGPPALENLPAYGLAKQQGLAHLYGVEDYTPEMLLRFGSALTVATVQQEINAIVRPAAESVAACKQLGCSFVAYGPLLGGLLSDEYLGRSRPRPDVDHSKQWDYLASIDAWAGWATFQQLLEAMRRVGDRHGRLPIATVALAYVLQLDGVSAAIVGVRLGIGADAATAPGHSASGSIVYHRRHRRATLEALRLRLSADDVRLIEAVLHQGNILDGLART